MSKGTGKPTFFEKLATVIVDKRNLIFFLYACALIFCLFSRNWVSVCNDITEYLPETTETRQGLTLMEEEFTTFGTARVMVSHVTYEMAEELEITAIDVGQGDGFLIRYQDTGILIDGGSTSESELGKYTLEPVLLSQGVSRLSAAIISHCDADHTSGLSYLLSNTPELTIERLLLPKAAREDPAYDPLKAFFSQEDIHYFSEGDRLSLPGGPELLCLYPGRARTPELKSHSEALLLRYGGFSMLFTGDMMKGDEALLAKALRQHQALSEGLFLPGRLTVYKAAHHGSRSSLHSMKD